MECMIQSYLDDNFRKIKNKQINVIKRYIHLKYKIDISLNALSQKLEIAKKYN
jgi:hypothetical protein